VLRRARQERDDVVGVSVKVPLENPEEDHPRVPRRIASQIDEGLGPDVSDL
jgi:hypothetical protein